MSSTSPVYACAISFGETEAGNRITNNPHPGIRSARTSRIYAKFLADALAITPTTAPYYGQIMERIFKAHPPKKKVDTEDHLRSLRVDLNDVWTAAIAWEKGLKFITTDGMPCIRAALQRDVDFDDWITPSSSSIVLPPPSLQSTSVLPGSVSPHGPSRP
jgi:predicted nucleic acid-binding protein